ncbi:hypothetical protein [Mycetocola sp. 2940]|uniref:hypothetical protein n=1 Tax=Mycetocola sp. 2940 TaxID=3156452 RepID=UPI00339A2C1F
MSDTRDMRDELKTNDADVQRADRTDAANTGSTSADTTDDNMGVLGDVAHPFDQTNGILDAFDETHPGNVTGESPSEFAASAGPAGEDAPRVGADDTHIDDDTPLAPPIVPPAGR